MIASALLYLGAVLALAGPAALVLPRRIVGRRGRRAGLVAVVTGIAFGLVGVALPARDVVVPQPRERLDAVMPRYQFHERHTIAIAATQDAVDRAVRAVTTDEIRFYRALTWLRRGGRRGPESIIDVPRGTPILAVATRTGFHLLLDEPGREVVFGVVGPVSPAARAAARNAARRGAPRPFVAAADGHASIAMNFRIAGDGRGGSVLSTETRVFAPDAGTRRRFAVYWRVIYPGSAVIRREWLAAIRRRAETVPP